MKIFAYAVVLAAAVTATAVLAVPPFPSFPHFEGSRPKSGDNRRKHVSPPTKKTSPKKTLPRSKTK